MEKLILASGNVMNATSSFASVTSVYNKVAINRNQKYNLEAEINKSIKNSNLNNDLIVKNILNPKNSALSITREINDNDIKTILRAVGNNLLINKQITIEEYNNFSKSVNTNLTGYFKKELRKEILKHRKEIKTNSLITKLYKKNSKTLITDSNKNYSVNIDDETNSSKNLLEKLFQLEEDLKKHNQVKSLVDEQIIKIENLIKKLKIALISTSVISIISSIFSLFFPVVTFVSLGTSVASISLNISINHFERQRDYLYQRLENLKKFSFLNLYPGLTAGSYIYGAVDLKYNLVSSFLVRKTDLTKIVKSFSKTTTLPLFTGTISTIADSMSIYYSTQEIQDINKRLIEIDIYSNELENKVKDIIKKLDNIKEVEWVVINETPKTDYYFNGGVGGKNLVFKNLKTNEEKDLSYMLSLSNIELEKYNMIKVYNSKLNDWYIRKLPNNTKKDNLG
ncbi:hypothetical protein [Mycoplasmopsis felis]|uniref:hypothetical protein n=1 Tax=Mycoplasmopsis felis TaxID=33923 RepID=UPI002AFE3C1B|nr:hypothetical protein [Mycoplasmopsis felis]WQQ10017.1 hypothetical protein RRG49_03500 [Mycoplasmopsis felis]